MVIFNMKWKKYNEIQLTKNIMDLNIRKMTNHTPSKKDINKKNVKPTNNTQEINTIIYYWQIHICLKCEFVPCRLINTLCLN